MSKSTTQANTSRNLLLEYLLINGKITVKEGVVQLRGFGSVGMGLFEVTDQLLDNLLSDPKLESITSRLRLPSANVERDFTALVKENSEKLEALEESKVWKGTDGDLKQANLAKAFSESGMSFLDFVKNQNSVAKKLAENSLSLKGVTAEFAKAFKIGGSAIVEEARSAISTILSEEFQSGVITAAVRNKIFEMALSGALTAAISNIPGNSNTSQDPDTRLVPPEMAATAVALATAFSVLYNATAKPVTKRSIGRNLLQANNTNATLVPPTVTPTMSPSVVKGIASDPDKQKLLSSFFNAIPEGKTVNMETVTLTGNLVLTIRFIEGGEKTIQLPEGFVQQFQGDQNPNPNSVKSSAVISRITTKFNTYLGSADNSINPFLRHPVSALYRAVQGAIATPVPAAPAAAPATGSPAPATGSPAPPAAAPTTAPATGSPAPTTGSPAPTTGSPAAPATAPATGSPAPTETNCPTKIGNLPTDTFNIKVATEISQKPTVENVIRLLNTLLKDVGTLPTNDDNFIMKYDSKKNEIVLSIFTAANTTKKISLPYDTFANFNKTTILNKCEIEVAIHKLAGFPQKLDVFSSKALSSMVILLDSLSPKTEARNDATPGTKPGILSWLAPLATPFITILSGGNDGKKKTNSNDELDEMNKIKPGQGLSHQNESFLLMEAVKSLPENKDKTDDELAKRYTAVATDSGGSGLKETIVQFLGQEPQQNRLSTIVCFAKTGPNGELTGDNHWVAVEFEIQKGKGGKPSQLVAHCADSAEGTKTIELVKNAMKGITPSYCNSVNIGDVAKRAGARITSEFGDVVQAAVHKTECPQQRAGFNECGQHAAFNAVVMSQRDNKTVDTKIGTSTAKEGVLALGAKNSQFVYESTKKLIKKFGGEENEEPSPKTAKPTISGRKNPTPVR